MGSAMRRTHLDRKNLALALLIYRLRQDIDVYRIIGINAGAAKRLGGHRISGAFFGYVQGVAHESMALTTRKIFDWEDPKKKYRLNSISGVLARVDKLKFTAQMAKNVERFCAKYGNRTPQRRPAKYLQATVELFRNQHVVALERLRTYRNQRIAHSQFIIHRKRTKSDKTLPSLDQFEALFDFAVDFYKLVSDGLLNIGPTGFAPNAGTGLVRTLKHLGLAEAKFDFQRKP